MFLNIPLIADWHAITQRREYLIHETLMRENQKEEALIMPPNKGYLRENGYLGNWMNKQVVHMR